jgi:hypothetical protein
MPQKLAPSKTRSAGSRKARLSRFNAAEYLAKLPAAHPIYAEDLVRRYQRGSLGRLRQDLAFLIREFVGCFQFDKRGTAYLVVRPDDALLGVLAERFRSYLRGKGSLDSAFKLKADRSGPRAGRRLEQAEKFGARFAYEGFRADNMPVKQAIAEVARLLNCSESKARSLIFRPKRVNRDR